MALTSVLSNTPTDPAYNVNSPESSFHYHPSPTSPDKSLYLQRSTCDYGASLATPEPHNDQVVLRLHQELVQELNLLLSTFEISISDTVQTAITLACQYLFASAPILHEGKFRADGLWLFGPDNPGGTRNNEGARGKWANAILNDGERSSQIQAIRTFSVITGLCAAVGLGNRRPGIPDFLVLAAGCFLRASKLSLRLIEDQDINHPNSSSLIVRIFHAQCHQHATGETVVATFFGGQARLLAQDLRLYDESVYSKYDPTEAQMLRNAFWLLYTADQAAAALRSRPFTLHDSLFDTPLTVKPVDKSTTLLLDPSNPRHAPPFEERLLAAFAFAHRMRAMAAELTLGIRLFRRRHLEGCNTEEANLLQEVELRRMSELFISFSFILDRAPPHITDLGSSDSAADIIRTYQRESFLVQRSQIHVTFHCLRFTILHQCVEHDLTSIMGFSTQPMTLAVKKMEIGRDFVNALQDAPFFALQALGEPIVEQVRHVGSILLQLSQSVSSETIKSHADLCLSRLVNVLSRLDSKASDALIEQSRSI
ncbi:hypothetical protein BJX66DRAFT_312671 [Aspergillus keveii]|uniref:Xylanolytic transcriptional activator regulatory domain-containing protein n=1 Tax=Aspergillus keveii TaxID=714993 RepID=A0ABR4FTD0_9EURO